MGERLVDGYVVMLLNLTADSLLNGGILLVTGNIRIDIHADVNGDVDIISGNVVR